MAKAANLLQWTGCVRRLALELWSCTTGRNLLLPRTSSMEFLHKTISGKNICRTTLVCHKQLHFNFLLSLLRRSGNQEIEYSFEIEMEEGFAGLAPRARFGEGGAASDEDDDQDDGLKTYFLDEVMTWSTISSLMRHDSFLRTYTLNTAEDKAYVGCLLTAAKSDFEAIYNIGNPAPVDLS